MCIRDSFKHAAEKFQRKRAARRAAGMHQQPRMPAFRLDPRHFLHAHFPIVDLRFGTCRSFILFHKLFDEHTVAEREEAVFLVDRRLISRHDLFFGRKRAHKHDQRRLRQMEIGDQTVDRFELITRENENIGIFMTLAELAILAHDRFQCPAAGRTDRDNPPAFRFCLIQPVRRGLIHHEEFRMHVMIGDILSIHRPERA